MRAEVLIAAAMLASAGTASAGGYGGHAAGHAASATASASAHAATYAAARGSSRSFAAPGGLQGYGYAARGPSPRSYQPGGYGYGYGYGAQRYGRYGYGRHGYGAGLGLYAGYGLGDALETDTSGYDYEGSPQPYGPPGYPPPPYLAPTGYGPGFGHGPGFGYGGSATEVTDRVHVSGEGVYAYGYYGHSETPDLPYDALLAPEATGYGQGGWVQPPAGMASAYPGVGYGPACGC